MKPMTPHANQTKDPLNRLSLSKLPQTLSALPAVGAATEQALIKAGISSPFQLVTTLPLGFEDRSRLYPISQLTPDKPALVQATVVDLQRRGSQISATLSDQTGELNVSFFKSYPSLLTKLSIGNTLNLFGKPQINRFTPGMLSMSHPELSKPSQPAPQRFLSGLYPNIKGLSQNKWRTLIRTCLPLLQNSVDPLSDLIAGAGEAQSLIGGHFESWLGALEFSHLPPAAMDDRELKLKLAQAKRRLSLDELTAHQLMHLGSRSELKAHKAPLCPATSPLADQLLSGLPFEPTGAQDRVYAEIREDLTRGAPMHRLLQGDVGSGKTLIAALAVCHALDGGWQVALLAPTEILAQQHFVSLGSWLRPLGIEPIFLSGSLKASEKTERKQMIEIADRSVVIGTHALFQESVNFGRLGLIIIDEQHRFGVNERLKLRQKGIGYTHLLALSATPIPRTLAMSLYAEMDTSKLDELPKNRKPITTVLVSQNRREQVIERVVANLLEGTQAYWVCPLIEDSEVLDATSAEQLYAELCAHPLLLQHNLRVGLIHGRLAADQKTAVMRDFIDAKLDVLVATTVIEVGVDVPNANLMVIENAERLGLSQLHQLRGRVGRGSEASFCVLLYSNKVSETGVERLSTLKNSSDGFEIAEVDLKIRGPGELLGSRQAGNLNFYVADLTTDEALLALAVQFAHELEKKTAADKSSGSSDQSTHQALSTQSRALIQRWVHQELSLKDA